MSRAKPIVGTSVGGTAEAVEEGRTGLLVPPEDPESLASALERLHRDETLRRAMGEAGRRKVLAEFSLSRMADQTLSCYHRILEESSRRAGAAGNAALAEGAGE
jgi:glycosyltransferase involved in cell wall biosynthesis